MRTEKVNVADLYLWEANPRVDRSNNQEDELYKIYNSSNSSSEKTSHRQLMNLAKSIAQNGYQNEVEPILVRKIGNRYVVQDANRRLSAIKLLSNPDKYRDLLEEKDYNIIKQLSVEFSDNIPSTLDVVVFDDGEEEKLEDVLSRKHNGPLDGVGTLPWSTEAKDRFTKKITLAEQITGSFEKQFGESLISYLGGSNAITSIRRVFGFRNVKEYLNINDPEHVTPEELDRTKEFIDELKQFSTESNILYSRLSKNDIEQNVLVPLKDKKFRRDRGITTITPQIAMLRTSQDFFRSFSADSARHLGARYNKEEWINFEDQNFESVNLILVGLGAYGILDGDEGHRLSKAYLLAPVVRVLYELSLQALNNSGLPDFLLPNSSVSKEHKKNVGYVTSLLRDQNFENYLSERHILFETYNEVHSVLNATDFAQSVDNAQLLSHKSAKDYPIDTVMRLFEEAVLFSVLSERYAIFKKNVD
jgi:hypothetical protein